MGLQSSVVVKTAPTKSKTLSRPDQDFVYQRKTTATQKKMARIFLKFKFALKSNSDVVSLFYKIKREMKWE